MQVVIDIDKEIYETIKNNVIVISGLRNGKKFLSNVFMAVANGTPYQEPAIDEIRAKIEKLKAWIPGCTMYGSNQIDGINMVLRIFDEYKTESEE